MPLGAASAYGLGFNDCDAMTGLNKFPVDSVWGSVVCGAVASCHDKCMRVYLEEPEGWVPIVDDEAIVDVAVVAVISCGAVGADLLCTAAVGYSSGGTSVLWTVVVDGCSVGSVPSVVLVSLSEDKAAT